MQVYERLSEIEQHIGVPSYFTPRGGERPLKLGELRELDDKAEGLEADLRALSKMLDVGTRFGTRPHFLLDWDVSRAAIDWFASDATDGFWSALFLQISKSDILLPPGASYEATNHLAQLRLNSERRERSPFFQLNELEFDPQEIARIQTVNPGVVSTFKEATVDKKRAYVLSLIQEKIARPEAHQFKKIEWKVFEHAASWLARGARTHKWVNNRVDALNYATVAGLNLFGDTSAPHYILISNTPSMRGLDAAMSRGFRYKNTSKSVMGCVQSARTVAMYLVLLALGGNSTARAERVAFDMITTIAEYRARLRREVPVKVHEMISRGEASDELVVSRTRLSFSLDEELVTALSSFDEVQSLIDLRKLDGNETLNIFSTKYRRESAKDIYDKIGSTLDELINNSKHSVGAIRKKKVGRLKVERILDLKSPFLNSAYDLKTRYGAEVAKVHNYDHGGVVFMDCTAPIPKFLQAINQINESIGKRLVSGSIDLPAEVHNQIDLMGNFVVGLTGRVLQNHIPTASLFGIIDIAESLGCLPSEIEFLRYENSVFSMSYEGDVVCFMSHASLPNELALFMRSLCEPEFKTGNFDQAATDIQAILAR